MDILDSLRQAPSAELYRLYLAIGKMLDDPRRILEIRQRLHLGMAINYIGDNPLGPPAQGTIVELRQTQAVVQDGATRRRWGVLYAAIIPENVDWSVSRRIDTAAENTTQRILHRRHSRIHRQAPERARRHHRSAKCEDRLDRRQ